MKKLLIALTVLLALTGCTSKPNTDDEGVIEKPSNQEQIAAWEKDRETFAGTAYGDLYDQLDDEGYTYTHVGASDTFTLSGMTFTPTSFDSTEDGSHLRYDVDLIPTSYHEYNRLDLTGFNHEGGMNIDVENTLIMDSSGQDAPGEWKLDVYRQNTGSLPSAVIYIFDRDEKVAVLLHLELFHEERVVEEKTGSDLDAWYQDSGTTEDEVTDLNVGDTFMFAGLKHTLTGFDTSKNNDNTYIALFTVTNETDEYIKADFIVPIPFDGAGSNVGLRQITGNIKGNGHEAGQTQTDVRYGFIISDDESVTPGTFTMAFKSIGGEPYRITLDIPEIHQTK